jgi:hypothetical protein
MTKTRIVETAIDHLGNSYVFSDKNQAGWDLEGHTITDLFFSKKCPPDMLKTSEEMEDKTFNLKPGELRFFRSDIFPTRPVYNHLAKDEKPKNFKEFFYHSTTTVDYIIVVQGEIIMIVGEKEVSLKAGDVVIQRGAAHAWHNYTNEKATIMGIMIGVELPKSNLNVLIQYSQIKKQLRPHGYRWNRNLCRKTSRTRKFKFCSHSQCRLRSSFFYSSD